MPVGPAPTTKTSKLLPLCCMQLSFYRVARPLLVADLQDIQIAKYVPNLVPYQAANLRHVRHAVVMQKPLHIQEQLALIVGIKARNQGDEIAHLSLRRNNSSEFSGRSVSFRHSSFNTALLSLSCTCPKNCANTPLFENFACDS